MDSKETTIPFGAFDSELHYHEINIPDGCEATIKDGKIIIRKIESEDEKIMKALIRFHKSTIDIDGIKGNEIVAWLEKQGEHKPVNNVEPRFHKGDWVVFNNRHDSVYQVEKIENYEYTLRHFLGGSMPLSFSHEDMIRAWTVKDVRDGDVLTNGNYPCLFKSINEGNGMFVYCGINGSGNFATKADGEDNIWDDEPENYCPAAKEQRDTLFEKMKEAGYEWDAGKKELKKIEDDEYNGEDYGIDGLWNAINILEKTLGKVSGYQSDDGILEHKCAITAVKKLYGQKSTEWSEEDSVRLQRIIDFLWYNRKGDTDAIYQQEQDIDWLKSLKPQNTWKPTDLQLVCLSDAIERYNSEGYPADVLKTLLRQLKKIG